MHELFVAHISFNVMLTTWRRLRKLMYRVVFPFELKLCNTAEACDKADSVYNLFAVVVHIGSGMNHGKAPCCRSGVAVAHAKCQYSVLC